MTTNTNQLISAASANIRAIMARNAESIAAMPLRVMARGAGNENAPVDEIVSRARAHLGNTHSASELMAIDAGMRAATLGDALRAACADVGFCSSGLTLVAQ